MALLTQIKPIKQIPRRLIYTIADNSAEEDALGIVIRHYRMGDTKTGKYLGDMVASPMWFNSKINTKIYPERKGVYKAFYIHFLEAKTKRQNVGSDFIKFAKAESNTTGCHGNVCLLSSPCYDLKNPPHLFYRKLGFQTCNPKTNEYLDKCIAENTQVVSNKFANLNMYM